MKVRFKSKEDRSEFMQRGPANRIIATLIGMNWWLAENRLNDGTIELVTPQKECIEIDGYYALIFMNERKYFHIIV